MFTGIVEELGEVVDLTMPDDTNPDKTNPDKTNGGARLTIRGRTVTEDLRHGASIAVNGVCLTVTDPVGRDTFTADVMPETLHRSTLGGLRPGDPVNLERAMSTSDRFDGHLVQGHVDGTTTVISIQNPSTATAPGEEPGWIVVTFALPEALRGYVAEKGSIAIDGVSLTVVDAGSDSFSVALIPTTLQLTRFGSLTEGEQVNLEVDVIAKYVARLISTGAIPAPEPVPEDES